MNGVPLGRGIFFRALRHGQGQNGLLRLLAAHGAKCQNQTGAHKLLGFLFQRQAKRICTVPLADLA